MKNTVFAVLFVIALARGANAQTITTNRYPPPSTIEVNIDLAPESTIKEATIDVFDLAGKKVVQTTVVILKEKSTSYPIDTSGLKKGKYFIVVFVAEKVRTFQFSKD